MAHQKVNVLSLPPKWPFKAQLHRDMGGAIRATARITSRPSTQGVFAFTPRTASRYAKPSGLALSIQRREAATALPKAGSEAEGATTPRQLERKLCQAPKNPKSLIPKQINPQKSAD
ncbi:hypothetical protein [Edaphobacter flagellatus]|uniref:hypothetical protein n=1 Tax=Edaphobacter flagellatus TaxID=1933044 RepID=UPI0021B2BF7A|nr:hypothetical protein [Edaphobacter flagellatus]